MTEAYSEKVSFDLREGEIAVELPEKFDASLYFIGQIRTPWKRREDCPKNPRESGETVCTIVVDPRWAQGL
ncbi:MAG: tRNA (N6-threonylcarbamoyladenosine(37)-N6)-methyltransferase TrmO, partial [Xanthobacteraceae bacterium]